DRGRAALAGEPAAQGVRRGLPATPTVTPTGIDSDEYTGHHDHAKAGPDGHHHRAEAAGCGPDQPPAGDLVLLLGRVRRAQLLLRHAGDPVLVPDAGAAVLRHRGDADLQLVQAGLLLPAPAGRLHRRPLAGPVLDHRRLLRPLRRRAVPPRSAEHH